MTGLNRLTSSLKKVCESRVLDENWLIASSLRAGQQWLDRVTLAGRPCLNIRIKTMTGLALELASAEMDRKGLSFLRRVRAEVLMAGLFSRLQERGRGYLSGLSLSPGLISTLLGSIHDLRLSGLKAADIDPQSFEAPEKGGEIQALLAEYERELETGDLVDYARVLGMAAARTRKEPGSIAASLILLPADHESRLRKMERDLWEAFPDGVRHVLPTDRPEELPEGDYTDSDLLGWINNPAASPEPKHDNTADIFRAIGEVNEVSEVFRRCLAGGIPFDDVEILYTDPETYLPLIHELSWRLLPEGDGSPPVTLFEGVPVHYSRPGRALTAWVSWASDGFPQPRLVRMIKDGLLQMDQPAEAPLSFTMLGAVLGALPIGEGRQRCLEVLDNELLSLGTHPDSVDEDGESLEGKNEKEAERKKALRILRSNLEELLEVTPKPGDSHERVLECARSFLEAHARTINRLDEYGSRMLLRKVGELLESVSQEDVPVFDPWQWLFDLPRTSNVGGLGPRPGCIYASPLFAGGHSGRGHTFIVGLDETRFPGAGLQDPLILDQERERIEGDLPLASARTGMKTEDLARLIARLRGNVVLSWCCRDIPDDREVFPGPPVIAAFRILSGEREGVLDDLLGWRPHPMSFAPAQPGAFIDPAEWWLYRLCGHAGITAPEELIGRSFPHLGRGMEARNARLSSRFTEYDGYVPEAGSDLDPFREDAPPLSATSLETLGRCPFEFFLKHVLKIEPPEEYLMEPGAWLDPVDKGSLMHELFCAFMSELCEKGLSPEFGRDYERLLAMLHAMLEEWRRIKPPPNSEVFERERNELAWIARIFLVEEEGHSRGSRPCFFEAVIGMRQHGRPTRIDASAPVRIELPRGKSVRLKGKIDRVDEIQGPQSGKRFSVWDYKTGSAWKYQDGGSNKKKNFGAGPFWRGRCVQNAFYLLLAQARLKELFPDSSVELFGYFFPTDREHGERYTWSREELERGGRVIEHLCETLASGCFVMSNVPDDVKFSDFRRVFGNTQAAASQAEAKLRAPENKPLLPFAVLRELRKLEKGDE